MKLRGWVPFALLVTVTLTGGCGAGTEDRATAESAEARQAAPGTGGAASSSTTPTTERRVLGTIEATVDGDSRTWYVVAGEASDGPYASGIWMEMSSGRYTVVIGGLDDRDPPIHTFSRSDLSNLSLGDYDGSTLALSVEIPEGGGPASFSVPGSGEGGVTVMYMPVASVDFEDMSGMYQMVEGSLTLEEGGVSAGEARARGTFSGTFESMAGGGSVTITEGRFDVEALPNVEAIQPEQ